MDNGNKITIDLLSKEAPKTVNNFIFLAKDGYYDGITFHRVIPGFMAQSGDVQFGNTNNEDFDLKRAGTGGSKYPK